MRNSKLELSKEEQMLLHCCRVSLRVEDREALRQLLLAGVDWDLVLAKSLWHRLSGMLYHHLKDESFRDLVPQEAWTQIVKRYRYNIARYMCQRNEMHGILEDFNGSGITATLLKGGILREQVYPDPAMRPMNDIDLLVPTGQVETAYQIVLRRGYVSTWSEETEQETREDHRHMPLLEHHQNHTWVEVHRHITREDSPIYFDISSFWQQAVPVEVAGSNALGLSPEHMVLHLSVHYLLDKRLRSTSALGQLCDISEAAQRYMGGVDWDKMLDEVKKVGLEAPMYYVMYTAKILLGTPVPDWTLDGLRPGRVDERATHMFIRERVLDDKDFMVRDLVRGQGGYLSAKAAKSVLKRFFPNRFSLAEAHGLTPSNKKVLLYYPVSWWDSMTKIVKLLVRPSRLGTEYTVDRWMHALLWERGK